MVKRPFLLFVLLLVLLLGKSALAQQTNYNVAPGAGIGVATNVIGTNITWTISSTNGTTNFFLAVTGTGAYVRTNTSGSNVTYTVDVPNVYLAPGTNVVVTTNIAGSNITYTVAVPARAATSGIRISALNGTNGVATNMYFMVDSPIGGGLFGSYKFAFKDLTNFIAGSGGQTSSQVTNIVAAMTGPAGSNFITSARLAGSNYLTGLFTNANQFGANKTLTIKSGAVVTNLQIWSDSTFDNITLRSGANGGSYTPSLAITNGGQYLRLWQNVGADNQLDFSGNLSLNGNNLILNADFTFPSGAVNGYVLTTDNLGAGTWQVNPALGVSNRVNSFSVANSNLSYAIGTASTNYTDKRQYGSAILTNLSGTGAMTNGIVAGGQITLSTNGPGQTVVTASTNITTLAAGSITVGAVGVTNGVHSTQNNGLLYSFSQTNGVSKWGIRQNAEVTQFDFATTSIGIPQLTIGQNDPTQTINLNVPLIKIANAGILTPGNIFTIDSGGVGYGSWQVNPALGVSNTLISFSVASSNLSYAIGTASTNYTDKRQGGSAILTNIAATGAMTNGLIAGSNMTLTTNGANQVVFSASTNGIDTAFIRGLLVTKSGNAAIAVSAGSWYHNASNRVYSLPASTLSLTVSASTLYSVYASVSNSLPVLEAFAENPPATNYFGSARQRASGTLGRWIGHFITDSGSIIAPTGTTEAGANSVSVMYQTPGTILNRILSAGAQTGLTVLTADAICPKYASTEMWSTFQSTYATTALAPLLVQISLDGTNVVGVFGGYVSVANNFVASSGWFPLSTNNTIYYKNTITSPGVAPSTYVDVYGVKYAR